MWDFKLEKMICSTSSHKCVELLGREHRSPVRKVNNSQKISSSPHPCIRAWTDGLICYVHNFESLIQSLLELKLFLNDLSQSLQFHLFMNFSSVFLCIPFVLFCWLVKEQNVPFFRPESIQRMMPYWHIKLGKYEITKLPLASTDSSWISRKRKVKVLAISFSHL